jgi:hypothetical protein
MSVNQTSFGGLSAEPAVEKVVVDRVRPFCSGPASRRRSTRSVPVCTAERLVLPGSDPASGELVGDEAVPECGIVGVDVAGLVDQMRIVAITLCERSFASLVEHLGGEPKRRQVTLTGTPSLARSQTSGYIILG